MLIEELSSVKRQNSSVYPTLWTCKLSAKGTNSLSERTCSGDIQSGGGAPQLHIPNTTAHVPCTMWQSHHIQQRTHDRKVLGCRRLIQVGYGEVGASTLSDSSRLLDTPLHSYHAVSRSQCLLGCGDCSWPELEHTRQPGSDSDGAAYSMQRSTFCDPHQLCVDPQQLRFRHLPPDPLPPCPHHPMPTSLPRQVTNSRTASR